LTLTLTLTLTLKLTSTSGDYLFFVELCSCYSKSIFTNICCFS